jgi:hypothetical protein
MLSKEEREMADNYSTILRNLIPEVWFDPGIKLGGGMPLTVCNEGIERKYRHIVSLETSYSLNLFILWALLSYSIKWYPQTGLLNYLLYPLDKSVSEPISRAPCHHKVRLFSTSINLVPVDWIYIYYAPAASDMLLLQKSRISRLGKGRQARCLQFPPSYGILILRSGALTVGVFSFH